MQRFESELAESPNEPASKDQPVSIEIPAVPVTGVEREEDRETTPCGEAINMSLEESLNQEDVSW